MELKFIFGLFSEKCELSTQIRQKGMFTSSKEHTRMNHCKEFIFIQTASLHFKELVFGSVQWKSHVLRGNIGCSQLSQGTEKGDK